jgi:DNA-directed RNA polymerase subunit H
MENYLVPRHIIMSEEEVEELLKEYDIDRDKLPKILMDDPCAKALGAQPGQILKIERESPTAGTSYYFRMVVEEKDGI